MKRCPVCQSTFEDRVDFCFKDGAPLEDVDASADPTALPDPGTLATPPAPSAPASTPKKSRGRGMFARPSVADMLTGSGNSVPPVGGNRVSVDAPQTTLGAPTIADPAGSESPEKIAEPVASVPDQSEAETVPDFTELPDPAFDQSAGLPEFQMGTPSLEVPVSPAAVDLPDSAHGHEDSALGPPGLESEPAAVSLEDSWFGGEEESHEPAEDVPGQPEADPIEDPGFADVTEAAEVGFDDTSWSPNGTPATQDASIPKGMILGGIAVLAAAVVLTVALSGDEQSPLPAAEPVVEVQAPEPAPPPPVPVVEEVAEDSGELGEEVAATIPVEDELVDDEALPVVAPPVEPAVVPPPPQPAVSPPPAAPPAAAPAPPQTRTAKANPPSVWTGTPTAGEPAPSAPAANPWGAPAEVASRGRLTITTDPAGAVVFVGDRRIGRSPTQTEVAYGNHDVRVEMVNYETNSRSVSVQAGEVSVPFRLSPAALVGRCNLLGEPGANVKMNGSDIGSLPLTVECSPGVHRFDVTPASGGETFILSKAVTFVNSGETENIFLNP